MRYDETELVEFFGILPSEQDPEEEQFFGTTNFDYHQSRYHLSVSFSTCRSDFYLDLKDAELPASMLELRVERVEEIRVRRDKSTSAPVLLVTARCKAEDNETEAQVQTIELILEPNICIRFNNRSE